MPLERSRSNAHADARGQHYGAKGPMELRLSVVLHIASITGPCEFQRLMHEISVKRVLTSVCQFLRKAPMIVTCGHGKSRST